MTHKLGMTGKDSGFKSYDGYIITFDTSSLETDS